MKTIKVDLFRIHLTGCLAVVLAGCSQVTGTSPSNLPALSTSGPPTITVTSTIPAVPTQEDAEQSDPSLPIPAIAGLPVSIEKSRADLAQRLSVSASDIHTTEAQGVLWPDASLGCPLPGMTYTQTEIPGFLIVLEYGGQEFEYHASIHDNVFYCENPTPPILETPGGASPNGQII